MTDAAPQIAQDSDPPLVHISDLVFAWPNQEPVINIPELTIARGERVFLAGPSGSGKSTLLGLVGGVLTATSGEISILGKNLSSLGAAERDRYRSDYVGFVFQIFNLLPYLSVIDNVTLPCRFSRRRKDRALRQSQTIEAEAERLLQHLDISPELMRRRVTDLSIGQQQRVAASRALIGAPELLIADEPTSALDHGLRERFIDLLLAECDAAESAVLFVSHDVSLGPLFDRQIALSDINQADEAHE